ncbi:DUF2961 domain-containing protein [Mucilaginibacter sp. BJC16-A38]|uniref:DUF2961 domain-containing protein n=1 Tax=Mucilaginibacter phenanthrenivorans TaxID=1234842 RepID=UPI00215830F6|nr:DUF2961 domain-containing protein [Mucilaginibacter phenanthrenivorans]MCR8556982.1 DUF2961 domain-containing protein [Mucilaginibacter phenanthrenivorans]
MKIKILTACLLFPFCALAQKITLSSELRQLSDISLLPAYRTNTVESEETTYDRKGLNDDGFGGTYSFIRKNPDGSLVMLDIDGPGVLNRIATPTPTKDTLDFYLDHEKKPRLSICYMDLFTGKVKPFQKPLCDSAVGGYFCYFPIPFQKHLMIVSRGHNLQFHQLGYRLFPKGTKVDSFNPTLSAGEQNELDNLVRSWKKTPMNSGDTSIHIDLKRGEYKTLWEMKTGGRIKGIEIDTAGTENLRISVKWDKESLPAVECSLREFFGYAFGQPTMKGLLSGTKAVHYAYFPMPFDQYARIDLWNAGSTTVNVKAKIAASAEKRDPQKEGKFYVTYVQHQLGRSDPWHVFLDIRGKGHYVGTILKGSNSFRGLTGFFEGDDSTATDGKFRMHGTGSEDYFNGGWYDMKGKWEHAESRALSGCLAYGHEPVAHTGGFRFFINDKLSFENSIWHGIEHGASPVYNEPVNYTSLSFYYCDRGKMEQLKPE